MPAGIRPDRHWTNADQVIPRFGDWHGQRGGDACTLLKAAQCPRRSIVVIAIVAAAVSASIAVIAATLIVIVVALVVALVAVP